MTVNNGDTTKELPTAQKSNEKIKKLAPFAYAYLQRKGADDLAEMLGVAPKEA